jgi:hypothetical protein
MKKCKMAEAEPGNFQSSKTYAISVFYAISVLKRCQSPGRYAIGVTGAKLVMKKHAISVGYANSVKALEGHTISVAGA